MCVCVCVCVCVHLCVYVCVCVCVCVLCVCVYVCVTWLRTICLSYEVANGNTPVPNRVVDGDQVGSGIPRIGLASQQQGFIVHIHQTMQKAVLAPGPGLLTQVPAIIHDPSTLLRILLPGLNSMLVNRLLSVPWLGK